MPDMAEICLGQNSWELKELSFFADGSAAQAPIDRTLLGAAQASIDRTLLGAAQATVDKTCLRQHTLL